MSKNSSISWEFSNILLNRSKKKISVEIGNHEDTTYQNTRDVAKLLLRENLWT